ncbi:MAG: phospholipid carrier-dependent glycosyltransferase [Taibaiella sp.]|nr:phospholipid carrier-dependent glycosyltransferase [Taibaiella sp.]
MKNKYFPYAVGLLLFAVAFIAGMLTYKDYGITWDELDQRLIGNLTYDYVTTGKKDLLTYIYRFYGTGFELPLAMFERWFHLTEIRDIYYMRHLVTHSLFLLSALSLYILSFRLTRSVVIASLCFLMLLFAPRIYAHSFFNTKDIPFLCMFLITMSFSQLAFSRNKAGLYLALGMLAGYTTSIRVMGIMLFGFIGLFMLLDLWAEKKRSGDLRKQYINIGLYGLGFCVALYVAWPYLWRNPIGNFIESYQVMSHYDWDASVLIGGAYEHTTELPWTYFPTWFVITTPLLWTLTGAAGLVLIVADFVKKPRLFLANGRERNYLLFLLCFLIPVLAVIKLNAVIYDDWRHLYFVYPSFVLAGMYFINKVFVNKYKYAVAGLGALQLALAGMFMVKNHPFQQVYFSDLVNHEEEYLRENYELDYWGASFKEGLQYLATHDSSSNIKIACNYEDPVQHNIIMLNPADRKRFEFVKTVDKADYFITNFRGHKEDYPSKNVAYNIMVLNSSIMRIYKIKNTTATNQQ